MKYMKLGSKPDIFWTNNDVTTVATDLASDFTVQVHDDIFYLHRFPLLSKCSTLQKLAAIAGNDGVTRITEFPGGVEAFKLCAKFCYGITITLNAHNVLGVRCGAEYLGMTESMEKGNLVFKLEVFLSSSVLKSWKDSIIVLKTTKALLPWSQDFQLISRCIDAIASKTSVDPSLVEWSFTYTRKYPQNGVVQSAYANTPLLQNSAQHRTTRNRTYNYVPTDWWVEDICDLDIEFFYKTMVAIKSKGRMSSRLIGEALTVYATKWLLREHNHISDGIVFIDDESSEHRKAVLETIFDLLPVEKGSCSCSFLLKLLKCASELDTGNSLKMELVGRIALQLDEASSSDILLPSSFSATNAALYDVDLVQLILQQFLQQELMQRQSLNLHSPISSNNSNVITQSTQPSVDNNSEVKEFDEAAAGVVEKQHNPKLLRVAKLIDEYLAEIAKDRNLPPSKFATIAEAIPDIARPFHDGLYGAIDIYLKEHPELTKHEKKRLCGLMDCKKLSIDASKHAAQNERLPLRLVVQVLFFEQVRASAATSSSHSLNAPSPCNICKVTFPAQPESISDVHGNPDEQPNTNESEEWGSVHDESSKYDRQLELGNTIQPEMQKKVALAEPSPSMSNNSTHADLESTQATRPSMTKTLITNSKRMINRILSVRQSSSERSRGSDISRSSGSSVSSAAPPKTDQRATEPRPSAVRRGRHSIS